MKIESVSLQNFRCFGPEKTRIELESGVTAFVGGNGSGKTAVFQALARLFGLTEGQRRIRRHDFHVPADQEQIRSGTSLCIEVILCFPELEGVAEDDREDAVAEFFLQMAASGEGEPLKARLQLKATWTDDSTPDGNIDEELKWIHTLEGDFEWDECKRVLPAQRGSIQLVYIPATRDIGAQVTSFLKGRLWQAARWSNKFRNSAARTATLIQNRFDREEPAKFVLERLERRWRQVHEADTDTTPLLRLVDRRFDEFVRNAKFMFYPDESGRERELVDLSDGQRSLFHIALTAATLEVERDAFSVTHSDSAFDVAKMRRAHLTILGIEEPENSLAPFFLSRIIAQCREIGSLQSAQVAVSSHSSAILSRIDPEEVRYFRIERKSRESSVRRLSLPAADEEASRYVRLAVKAYPELYFARFVVLGEGESERLIIPKIAEAMGIEMDPSFVPIVPLGGRHVAHFWKLLNDLQIPHATLLDLDLGRRHGGAETVRTVVEALRAIGNDLSANKRVLDGDIAVEGLADLDHGDVCDGWEDNIWLQTLKLEGVYFSYPVDIDFSMLAAFQGAYQHPRSGGHGPRGDATAIQEKKAVTLKTGGDPSLFDVSYDDVFKWYPYLFLSSSKPETHLSALNRIEVSELADRAPAELRALIEHVKKVLALGGGEE